MSVSEDIFARPSDLPKGGLRIADIEGALVIVKPEEAETTVTTAEYGDAEVRPAKVLVVTGDKAGPQWQDILLFGAGLKAQAGAAVRSGRPIVGVVGKGEASKGRSAPWLFLDPTDKQVDAAREAYVRANAPF